MCKRNFFDNVIAAVDGWFKLVAFHFNGYHAFQIAEFTLNFFDLCHFSGNGRVHVGRNDAVGIGQQSSDFDLIAFFYQNFCRRADMLFNRNVNGFRQAGVRNRTI